MLRNIYLLFVFTILCCSKNDAQWSEVPLTIIAKGSLYGAGMEKITRQNLVIKNEDSWNALLLKINSVNDETSKFSKTEIDFSTFHILAIFDQIRSSGGYNVELTVSESAEKRRAKVVYHEPKDIATTVITQPYLIAEIPRSNLPIEFTE